MTWVVIRTATDEDFARWRNAAERFAARHNIPRNEWRSAVMAVEDHIYYLRTRGDTEREGAYLQKLWNQVTARALRDPSARGIAWGAIGHPANE